VLRDCSKEVLLYFDGSVLEPAVRLTTSGSVTRVPEEAELTCTLGTITCLAARPLDWPRQLLCCLDRSVFELSNVQSVVILNYVVNSLVNELLVCTEPSTISPY
jgi:hypothetical protein